MMGLQILQIKVNTSNLRRFRSQLTNEAPDASSNAMAIQGQQLMRQNIEFGRDQEFGTPVYVAGIDKGLLVNIVRSASQSGLAIVGSVPKYAVFFDKGSRAVRITITDELERWLKLKAGWSNSRIRFAKERGFLIADYSNKGTATGFRRKAFEVINTQGVVDKTVMPVLKKTLR